VSALAERDFGRLAGTLAPDVRMRALLPPGTVEVSGAQAVAGKFASWFGDMDTLDVIHTGREEVADRLHVFYRFRVERRDDDPTLVEQHVMSALEGGRIATVDLLCTGFRPVPGGSG
jgi:hypothetical protein